MKNDIEWIDILKAIGHKEELIDHRLKKSEWNELLNARERVTTSSPCNLKDLKVQGTTKPLRASCKIFGPSSKTSRSAN